MKRLKLQLKNIMLSGNSINAAYKQLRFERIDDISILSNFFCGVEKMDIFIHDLESGLQSFIVKHSDSETYIARIGEHIVGLFSIMKSNVEFDDEDKDDMILGIAHKPEIAYENPDYLQQNRFFEALEIAYLAIDKDWQHRGIGTNIISAIAQRAIQLIDNCQFLIVNAYHDTDYSAVGFYKAYGFEIYSPIPVSNTWSMIYVINPHILVEEKDS